VEDEGIAEMPTTPQSIGTLQRKLYRKARPEPACGFHALYDKIYRADILSHACNLVRANKGSAGIDGIFDAQIAAVCPEQGVSKLLTPGREGARFPGMETLTPDDSPQAILSLF
jgi:RNA-directed DNA polymerase